MEEEQSAAIHSIDEPGLRAEGDVLRGMRQEVARLLQRNSPGFPGAQPVSFARKHIEELQREDYYLCEKSDGIRYLLYATEDQGNEIHYLIDRKNDYYFVNNGNLHFPLPNKEQEFHRDTILDGELVVDTLPNGKTQFTFLVFDCLALDGQILMSRDLSKRLGYFRENLFVPYKSLLAKYPEERQYQPFFVEMKDMQLPYGIEAMFKDMIPKLRHGNDGLIFTCLKSEYKPGTDPHILKWKDADENSIDFKWRLSWDKIEPDAIDRAEGITEPYTDWEAIPHVELLVFHGGQGGYQPFAEMHLEESEWETLKSLGDPLNDRIVEAYMDEQKRWRFSRFRDDKTDANHISTVNSVIDSIRDGVTKDDLLAAAASIRQHWKARH
ncbi:mRNA capping enzyme [Microdochium trichocladiopsis]|uniref:mRNA-capping enzyme subunit alpha n=1 Tax=Microdochium trichocladiopsis TaxID=1682393 RepID=A0A9P9BSR1_9PEZI|nr:mRNA capping enzyme [Microdochium trichocladiopsis]KAH7038155.1 mRNA capping enzyme [Microdochium trichocladiopsis]